MGRIGMSAQMMDRLVTSFRPVLPALNSLAWRARMAAGLLAAGAVLCVATDLSNAEELSVKVENGSKPVLCAEEDNVTLALSSPQVRRFRIEAVHPAYLAALRKDNWTADWTSCDFGPGAEKKPDAEAANDARATKTAAAAKPKVPIRKTLYEAVDRWLVGLTFPEFWRKPTATVRVGEQTFEGLHLIQLWRVRPNGGEEVLVMYPQDGYWRARPIAPKGRDLTAFGSSFLIGPVEEIGRPVVRLSEITYKPDFEGFELAFESGGSATVRLAEVSMQRLALDVAFDRQIEKPFTALRSMYVTAFNNDMARVATRDPDAKGWREAGILDFKGAITPELWAGRHEISRHNTSSPDMIFKWFRK